MEQKNRPLVRLFLWCFALSLTIFAFTTNACAPPHYGTACKKGATRACVCPDSRNGTQACASDGLDWLSCDCSLTILRRETTEIPDTRPQPQPDKAQPQPDKAQPQPDKAQPQPDKAQPQPDKAQPQPDKAQPQPDKAQPQPDKAQPPQRYHPPGWVSSKVHGLAAKLGKQDCRSCHGKDLKGGSVKVSCDKCHSPGWRTNCTFCHGNKTTKQPAPPRDINNNTDLLKSSFRPHSVHVTKTIHPAYGCETCHTKPTNVLSPGHMFDATPGKAEVNFRGRLSKGGSYHPTTGCSQIYCHGNGRKTGSIKHTAPKRTCSSCHASLTSGRTSWKTMSGQHYRHLRMGFKCIECHSSVNSAGTAITKPELHVNGKKEVKTLSGLIFDPSAQRCTGTCHRRRHRRYRW